MLEQVIINSIEFARNSESLHGDVQVKSLDRLRDLLFSDDGALEYALTGRHNEDGKLFLACIIKGVLQLRCQRCLGALAYPVRLDSELELVENDPDLSAENDLADAIKADPNLDVLALVEDEVLLDLPMAPMHAPDACQAGENFGQPKTVKQNAFSALAALKTQDSKKI